MLRPRTAAKLPVGTASSLFGQRTLAACRVACVASSRRHFAAEGAGNDDDDGAANGRKQRAFETIAKTCIKGYLRATRSGDDGQAQQFLQKAAAVVGHAHVHIKLGKEPQFPLAAVVPTFGYGEHSRLRTVLPLTVNCKLIAGVNFAEPPPTPKPMPPAQDSDRAPLILQGF
eukprot:TRINITY_DN76596_c0_g1_i1.p1 TRINITY_DN76596_c0_g1~~TRINITY_DN76596_c0_g1_i1.p1  ORF type:complete len:172 (-),score=45.58 TRINITY_DN76596_c0_g1_i1:74-589(-)